MTDVTRERIFDQGFTTKGVAKGTGLGHDLRKFSYPTRSGRDDESPLPDIEECVSPVGMAIAHQIITEQHGGTISCCSELGKGSTFVLELPLSS